MTTPLDPQAKFAVVVLTRANIAENLNNMIEELEVEATVKKYTDDDPRLTDEFCQKYVESINDHLYEKDDEVLGDAEYNATHDLIESFDV